MKRSDVSTETVDRGPVTSIWIRSTEISKRQSYRAVVGWNSIIFYEESSLAELEELTQAGRPSMMRKAGRLSDEANAEAE